MLLRFVLMLAVTFIWLITITGFHYLYQLPKVVSVLVFVVFPLIGRHFHKEKIFVIFVLIGFIGMIMSVQVVAPSNDRDWASDHSVLPKIEMADHKVIIEGFRNFEWFGQNKFNPRWEERSFDLRKLKRLFLVVEPFKDSELMAHTMLRFDFGEDGPVIISVEARSEKNEEYSLLAGAYRQFELIYIFGDENDLFSLRAIYRGARIYVYPVKADHEFIVDLFRDLAAAANSLHLSPRFYRSIYDNCTTTLVKHIDRHYEDHIGLRYETLFPALTGKLLYDLGFMDTDLSYEEAKKRFRVDDLIREQK